MNKTIRIALTDFAIPCPLTGSLETYSGLGGSKEEGIELHQFIQGLREEEVPGYQSEVIIKQEFQIDGKTLSVEGRMDGFLDGEKPLIEEIKSTFNIWELAKHLRSRQDNHPYCLQLLTYGYFYYLQSGKKPDLNLILVSTRNQEVLNLDLKLKVEEYEAWLSRRLKEIALEIKRAEKRKIRRQELGHKLCFPFEKPRHGQNELIETIEEGFKNKTYMLLQAPTGLGKTSGVLYPSLKEALTRGQRVIYLTPKNSQHSVAEDALDKFEEKGCRVKSLTLTAKSKMCFKAEPLCNPDYCEFAKDYYDKLALHGLREQIAKKRKLTSLVFKNLGEKYQVCPFELQLEATEEADTIIADYNYVFGNRSAMGRLIRSGHDQEGLPNLVVDEAHNLPSRGMSYYSPSLSASTIERMREEFGLLPKKFCREGLELLDELQTVIKQISPENTSRPTHVDLPVAPFLEMDERLREFLSRYLESDIEIKPRDVVLRLCFYWNEFTDVLKQIHLLNRPEFFFTYHPDATGGMIKITCCDASLMLKEKYKNFQNVVLFSATLKPFDYYLKLSGLDDAQVQTKEFSSPFGADNRKILIIPQISTKYSDRQRNYSRIAETISRISAVRPGNYFAFFPSFDFLDQVFRLFRPPMGFEILRQDRNMRSFESEQLLERLRSERKPRIIFAVQGGIFSEGVDYPGDMLIGAFIIGPPLPSFDVERETMKDFYAQNYQAGFEYAYTYPAMAKAIQAAGRVIRTESDRGLIVLMDGRFLEPGYASTLPGDWFRNEVGELVSQSILQDVQTFWSKQD